MLLTLLRSSLTQTPANASVFDNVTPENWRKCYKLSESQGVKALAWDGLMTLPSEIRPSKQLFLNWALAVEKYEHNYEHYCKTIAKLSDFYSEHGISTMQMKGVAFSLYYPHPEHREGGDIDIYTYSSDTSSMSDEEANSLADKLMEQQGILVSYEGYKHSVFHYNGVEIENHKCFLNVKTIKSSVPVENELRKVLKPERVSLLDGKYSILVPSDAFNTLFISFHAMQHIGAGVNLHHVCDWACLLNKSGMLIPPELTDTSFHRGLSMFNKFVSRFFGTEVPTECSEDDLDKFFWLIMREPDEQKTNSHNPFKIIYVKIRHFYRFVTLRKIMLGEPIMPRLFKGIYELFFRPRVIFSKK